VLELLERFGGEPIGGVRRTSVVWGSVLPSDRSTLVSEEVQLVGARIHSRRTAMNLLGDVDQERELRLVLEEEDEFAHRDAAPSDAQLGARDDDAG
jgi:hypothetical protein